MSRVSKKKQRRLAAAAKIVAGRPPSVQAAAVEPVAATPMPAPKVQITSTPVLVDAAVYRRANQKPRELVADRDYDRFT